MSRSHKKNPAGGIATCRSEASDKRRWHSQWRMAVKEAMRRGEEVLPAEREVSEVWMFGKDGKRWFDQRDIANDQKILRK